jgi:ribose transport system permease protein
MGKLDLESIRNAPPANSAFIRNNWGTLIGLAVLCIVFFVLAPSFFTTNNLLNVLRQLSINAIIACGMTFVILLGGIDLSVGAVAAFSGSVTVGLMVLNDAPMWIAVTIGVLIGGGFGLVNGIVISKFMMPSFIVTLATQQIARGVTYIYTGGLPIRTTDANFNAIGTGYLGFIPIPVVIMLIVFTICTVLLNKTRFGYRVYAIGGNREAARFTGISIIKTEITVYSILGLLSGMAGIIFSARTFSAIPTGGEGYELDAIAAVVLGGTSFTGGRGAMSGTLIGVLILGILSNGMNLVGLSYYYQLVVKGFVILCAVYFDTTKKSKRK